VLGAWVERINDVAGFGLDAGGDARAPSDGSWSTSRNNVMPAAMSDWAIALAIENQ